MERITKLIKEVLSTPPKEKECDCGCGGCSDKGTTLNESVAPKQILSENLQYHVHNKLPLTENTFRYGSRSFLNLWQEARYLYLREIINVSETDQEILTETNLGEYGIFETVNFEGEEYDIVRRGDDGWIYLRSIHDTMVGKKEIKVKEKDITVNEIKVPLDLPMEELLNEAKKKKKKDPPIGKPKRGGSKAYYVYVRDPKTKKVKKVSFGSGGLKAKINNPKARQAFAARHKCAQKKDKTKAGYWSCRLPRYAKLLGLKSSFSGFW
jgi:hypothetical protein